MNQLRPAAIAGMIVVLLVSTNAIATSQPGFNGYVAAIVGSLVCLAYFLRTTAPKD